MEGIKTSSLESLSRFFRERIKEGDCREFNSVQIHFAIKLSEFTSLDLLALPLNLRKNICSPQGGEIFTSPVEGG